MSKKDYSVRIPVTPVRIQILKNKAVEKGKTRIKNILFKPRGKTLADFPPEKICVRLRKYLTRPGPATLTKLRFAKNQLTDTKKILEKGSVSSLITKADKLGYEKWGELETESRDYELKINSEVTILVFWQKISPVGEFIKIDSPTKAGLMTTLRLLKVKDSEVIRKNAAVLLAEKMC